MKVCLYHKNCMDGFGAAYAVWKADPSYQFVPMNYGDQLPDLTNCKELVMVDFSLPLNETKELMNKIKVIVIDHHETAQKNLESLIQDTDLLAKHDSDIFFNMNMSGAIMAWQYFHAKIDQSGIVYKTYDPVEPPLLLKYIEDRDLWKHSIPYTEEINSYLFSFVDFETTTFKEFDNLLVKLQSNLKSFVTAGHAISVFKDKMVNFICQKHHITDFLCPDGRVFSVPIVNSCVFQSEVGNRLCQNYPFSIIWFYDHEKNSKIYSLRSSSDGEHVGNICGQFNGGGHKHAAGFSVPADM